MLNAQVEVFEPAALGAPENNHWAPGLYIKLGCDTIGASREQRMALTEETYRKLVAKYNGGDVVRDISNDLIPLWCDHYRLDNPRAELVQVDTDASGNSFTYLFDVNLQRNIVAFGMPIFFKHRRDARRMAGHPQSAGAQYHRGHLMAHSIGGGTDINLIPQLGRLNMGAFRVLERKVRDLAEHNVRCLYFVRSIYTNNSQIPHMLEQCIIHSSVTITYAVHQNS